jgi:hypothetical protein
LLFLMIFDLVMLEKFRKYKTLIKEWTSARFY